MSEPAAPVPRNPRITARDREIRRRRIFARAQAGWSVRDIAEAEQLTRERIRQILARTLAMRPIDPPLDHGLLQIARLEAALRATAEKVAAGELSAIDRLIPVLERLDRHQHVAARAARDAEDEELFGAGWERGHDA